MGAGAIAAQDRLSDAIHIDQDRSFAIPLLGASGDRRAHRLEREPSRNTMRRQGLSGRQRRRQHTPTHPDIGDK
jgi:hypothetical protein